MKITKQKLRQFIKEEIEAEQFRRSEQVFEKIVDPDSAKTRTDVPQNVKNKAVALDEVESLLSSLLQQIREL